jgi:hypothetical protein
MNRARYYGAGLNLMCIGIVMGLIAGATRGMIQSGVAALAIITAVALLALASLPTSSRSNAGPMAHRCLDE